MADEYNFKNYGLPAEKFAETVEYAVEAEEFLETSELTSSDFNEYNYRHDVEFSDEEEDSDEDEEEEEEEDEEEESGDAAEGTKSLRSVFASVSVVAVTAVAVVLSDAPIIDVTQFDIGYENVEYYMDIVNETGSNVVISINGRDYEYTVEASEGVYEGLCEGLTPNTKYTFEVRGTDTLERTYFSREFRTSADPTEYDARITDMQIARGGDGVLKYAFELSDPYGYYSNFVLTLTDPIGNVTQIDITDEAVITAEQIPLDNSVSDGVLTLSCDTVKPSDLAQEISNKVLYTVEISHD